MLLHDRDELVHRPTHENAARALHHQHAFWTLFAHWGIAPCRQVYEVLRPLDDDTETQDHDRILRPLRLPRPGREPGWGDHGWLGPTARWSRAEDRQQRPFRGAHRRAGGLPQSTPRPLSRPTRGKETPGPPPPTSPPPATPPH